MDVPVINDASIKMEILQQLGDYGDDLLNIDLFDACANEVYTTKPAEDNRSAERKDGKRRKKKKKGVAASTSTLYESDHYKTTSTFSTTIWSKHSAVNSGPTDMASKKTDVPHDSYKVESVLARRKNMDTRNGTSCSEDRRAPSTGAIAVQDGSVDKTSENQHVQRLRETLGLTDADFEQHTPEVTDSVKHARVETVASYLRKDRSPVTVHCYQQPRSRKRKAATSLEENLNVGDFLDLNGARHDVRRFGIGAMEGKEQMDAETRLLLQLGAKPPKKEYVNYKELQEKIRQKKSQNTIDDHYTSLQRSSLRNNPKPRRKPKMLASLDGQLGRYKQGVQVIKKSDIRKANL